MTRGFCEGLPLAQGLGQGQAQKAYHEQGALLSVLWKKLVQNAGILHFGHPQLLSGLALLALLGLVTQAQRWPLAWVQSSHPMQ